MRQDVVRLRDAPLRNRSSASPAVAPAPRAATPPPPAKQRDELAPPHRLPLRPKVIPYHIVVGMLRCASQQIWRTMSQMGQERPRSGSIDFFGPAPGPIRNRPVGQWRVSAKVWHRMTIARGKTSLEGRKTGEDGDFVMKLFAVRTIEGQLPVGFFWVNDLTDLRLAVGGVVIDPVECEYKPITNDWAAIVWPNRKVADGHWNFLWCR